MNNFIIHYTSFQRFEIHKQISLQLNIFTESTLMYVMYDFSTAKFLLMFEKNKNLILHYIGTKLMKI